MIGRIDPSGCGCNKMENELHNKPLFQCTLGDFKAILSEVLREKQLESLADAPDQKRYRYGLAGIMDLFGCSISTAERMKQSGILDPAISQVGGIIVVDEQMALDLVNLSNKHKRILSRRNKKSNTK